MSKLGKIAFLQMLLGSASPNPYGPTRYHERQNHKQKNKGKQLTKVVYYTDENGQLKRKKVPLEEETK